jgi:hypothetical protein
MPCVIARLVAQRGRANAQTEQRETSLCLVAEAWPAPGRQLMGSECGATVAHPISPPRALLVLVCHCASRNSRGDGRANRDAEKQQLQTQK